MVIVVFMCTFICYTFRRDRLEYSYEQIDSNLTYSLLAASIINLNEYARTGNLIISDNAEPEVWDAAFVNSYVRFVDCLKNNLGLNDEMETIKEQGMNECVGPLGFTDMDREGLLIEGFDIIGSGRTKLEKEDQFEKGIEILRELGHLPYCRHRHRTSPFPGHPILLHT